jgi:hypothetical protein
MSNESTPPSDPTPETHPTPEETTTVEAEAQAEAASETQTTSETQKSLPPLTAERVTDITLGLGKAAVDALDKAARQLDDSVRQIRQDAPGFLTEMEEKGRPVREKITESLKSFSITDVFSKSPSTPGTPTADTAAFDDIEALENRVRELEQQVSGEPTPATSEPAPPPATSPFSMLELDDEPPAPTSPEPELEAKAEPEAEAQAEAAEEKEPEEKTVAKKPAARRTKKKEGETPAE